MTQPLPKAVDFEFSEQDFKELSSLVTSETGIMLPPEKKALMYGRLSRRLRALNLQKFSDYTALIKKELRLNNVEELSVLVNAMTTNVTSFFREQHHFDRLEKELPSLLEKFGKVRIWSSACSTGEEPWSIAMVVHQFKLANPSADITITASDLDTNAVAHAEKGLYMLEKVAVEKHTLLKKYLKETGKSDDNKFSPRFEYEIKPSLRSLITFKSMNLLKPWPSLEQKFHVLFCRNVIIYFSKETQRLLFAHFEEKLPQGACLYIGHSESLINVTDAFDSLGQTSYRKK